MGFILYWDYICDLVPSLVSRTLVGMTKPKAWRYQRTITGVLCHQYWVDTLPQKAPNLL